MWPEAIESVLAKHPGITEVAITAVPDPMWGQAVVALVVAALPMYPPTLAELRDWVKADLAAFCAPQQLRLVDAIPRTTLGKIRRGELVALATP